MGSSQPWLSQLVPAGWQHGVSPLPGTGRRADLPPARRLAGLPTPGEEPFLDLTSPGEPRNLCPKGKVKREAYVFVHVHSSMYDVYACACACEWAGDEVTGAGVFWGHSLRPSGNKTTQSGLPGVSPPAARRGPSCSQPASPPPPLGGTPSLGPSATAEPCRRNPDKGENTSEQTLWVVSPAIPAKSRQRRAAVLLKGI